MPRPKGHLPERRFKIICKICKSENMTAYPNKIYCSLKCRNQEYKARYNAQDKSNAVHDSTVLSSPSDNQWDKLAKETPPVPGDESK